MVHARKKALCVSSNKVVVGAVKFRQGATSIHPKLIALMKRYSVSVALQTLQVSQIDFLRCGRAAALSQDFLPWHPLAQKDVKPGMSIM